MENVAALVILIEPVGIETFIKRVKGFKAYKF